MNDFLLSSTSSFFLYLNWQSRIMIKICNFYWQSVFETTDLMLIFQFYKTLFHLLKSFQFWKF